VAPRGIGTRPSSVFRTLWSFAVERQRIYQARLSGNLPPWTQDPILSAHHFTNVFRAADRVSQFLIGEVAYTSPPNPEDTFFRIALFRLFNKIETWGLLRAHLGEISWREFDAQVADRLLAVELSEGRPIYSGAYILPPPPLGYQRKHQNHLALLKTMMEDDLPHQLHVAHSLQDVFAAIARYPGMGDFLAYQLTIDLNYSTMISFSEMDFVVVGPGAARGIRKCFPNAKRSEYPGLIRWSTENQTELAESFRLSSPTLWGRHMTLIDVQNLYCEVDKYARVAHPTVSGYGRSRIKRRFRPLNQLPRPWFPPDWGLNDLVGSCLPI
jgi:hypothetical protein